MIKGKDPGERHAPYTFFLCRVHNRNECNEESRKTRVRPPPRGPHAAGNGAGMARAEGEGGEKALI